MTNYEKIALTIDKEIAELSMQYDRKEKKWLLSSQEEIETVQSLIRGLKHKKTMAWEEYIVETKDCDPILKKMLEPIVRRRDWFIGDLRNDVNSGDGIRFTFPVGGQDFQPKHLKGFWSCPGCMLNPEKLPDYQNYRKAITWCPHFLPVLAEGRNPDQYKETLRRLNSDAAFCYAGLLHTELQATPTEIKLVRYCDSCNWLSIESKELATPVDPDKLTIELDPASEGYKEHSSIICKCNVCGELIFEEDSEKVLAPDKQTMLPEYEKLLDDHYQEKHPNEVSK